MNNLLANLEKIHTTIMGEQRIKKNLSLKNCDVVDWCKNPNKIEKQGGYIC